jgi:hypothetical protein
MTGKFAEGSAFYPGNVDLKNPSDGKTELM